MGPQIIGIYLDKAPSSIRSGGFPPGRRIKRRATLGMSPPQAAFRSPALELLDTNDHAWRN